MTNLNLVFVGKTAFPEIDTAIDRYLDRLRHYIPARIHIVKPEKIAGKGVEAEVREREGERILKLVGKQARLIVWDERGRQMDSPSYAKMWGRLIDEGTSEVWMAIGGPVGISPRLVEQASLVLSLSKMTFPHDMARLMVLEQTYRAFSILKGEPYHK
jgi:23S rRNA (pseudouridine1915-N3)-methyltransferase